MGGKPVSIKFPCGRDVLNAYWGFLSNGGLVLRGGSVQGLREGDAVALEVTIESLSQRYELKGQVVRRPNIDAPADHTVIAFDPGEPHDLLLSAAWAETDNVPARKHTRWPTERSIRFRWPIDGELEVGGRLVNVSRGGVCVRAKNAPAPLKIALGDKVLLVAGDATARVTVRWAKGADFGGQFESSADCDAFLAHVM